MAIVLPNDVLFADVYVEAEGVHVAPPGFLDDDDVGWNVSNALGRSDYSVQVDLLPYRTTGQYRPRSVINFKSDRTASEFGLIAPLVLSSVISGVVVPVRLDVSLQGFYNAVSVSGAVTQWYAFEIIGGRAGKGNVRTLGPKIFARSVSSRVTDVFEAEVLFPLSESAEGILVAGVCYAPLGRDVPISRAAVYADVIRVIASANFRDLVYYDPQESI